MKAPSHNSDNPDNPETWEKLAACLRCCEETLLDPDDAGYLSGGANGLADGQAHNNLA